MDNEKLAALEAVMFFWADPMDLESLSQVLNLEKKEVEALINKLDQSYKETRSGLEIKKINDSYQLVTKKEYSSYIDKLINHEDEKSLSKSLMETLSIIAYKQPVTRIEIDRIRGVNSSSSISSLISRGFVEELGKLDQIGRPIIYGTTDEFLRVFDLENINGLPKIEDTGEKAEEEDKENEDK